ncbi:MAG TPA: PPOX class F420-dependent oxidoreductase [Pseudonocardiaceae bacterium]|nr:PPOX class F420-dependent oxidoreductase [Pseudonocardiaceae bacterium]
MINDDIRRALNGTPIAHLATLLPDGSPHSVPLWIGTHGDRVVVMTGPGSRKARNLRHDPRLAISLTAPDNPYATVLIRGRVTEWLEGDAALPVIDELAHKYIGVPYPRDQHRVVALIEAEHAAEVSFG